MMELVPKSIEFLCKLRGCQVHGRDHCSRQGGRTAMVNAIGKFVEPSLTACCTFDGQEHLEAVGRRNVFRELPRFPHEDGTTVINTKALSACSFFVHDIPLVLVSLSESSPYSTAQSQKKSERNLGVGVRARVLDQRKKQSLCEI